MTENISSAGNSQDVKKMNIFSKIIGIFTSPGSTFQVIAQQPKWIVPALLIILINLGVMLVLQPVIVKEQITKTQERLEERGMDQDQIDSILEKSQQTMKYMMYPSAIIVTFLIFLLSAAIWLFVSNTIAGGGASYKQMLSVVVYTAFIPLVGSLIKTPIMLTQETMNVHFSLATFMSDAASDTFIYKFLVHFELFNIWAIITLCIGIAVVGKINVKKVWPWVVILFLLWYVGTSFMGGTIGG